MNYVYCRSRARDRGKLSVNRRDAGSLVAASAAAIMLTQFLLPAAPPTRGEVAATIEAAVRKYNERE